MIPIVISAPEMVFKDTGKNLKEREIRRIEIIQTDKIGQNTEKSPGDLRRPAVTQTPVKDNQLWLGAGKNLQDVIIII